MSKPCTVCTHSEREEIDRLIVGGETTYRRLSAQFSLAETSLRRHAGNHLPGVLIEAEEAKEEAHRRNLIAEVDGIAARVQRMYDACDRWLTDPDDPEQYDIGPRAGEVSVVYTQLGPDGKPMMRKGKLSELLARLEKEGGGLTVLSTEFKHADPRELHLKTAARMAAQLELIGKLLGQIDTRPQVNVIALPEWQQIRARIMGALVPFPDARIALADALENNARNN